MSVRASPSKNCLDCCRTLSFYFRPVTGSDPDWQTCATPTPPDRRKALTAEFDSTPSSRVAAAVILLNVGQLARHGSWELQEAGHTSETRPRHEVHDEVSQHWPGGQPLGREKEAFDGSQGKPRSPPRRLQVSPDFTLVLIFCH